MANSRLQESWLRYGHYRVLLPFVFIAFITPLVPLQKLLPLGRFQHYAIALALLSLGYCIHCIYTWKRLLPWGRVASVGTAIFFGSIAAIFWENPWLDYRVAVQTHEREEFRAILMSGYLLSALIILAAWNRCRKEEAKSEKHEAGS